MFLRWKNKLYSNQQINREHMGSRVSIKFLHYCWKDVLLFRCLKNLIAFQLLSFRKKNLIFILRWTQCYCLIIQVYGQVHSCRRYICRFFFFSQNLFMLWKSKFTRYLQNLKSYYFYTLLAYDYPGIISSSVYSRILIPFFLLLRSPQCPFFFVVSDFFVMSDLFEAEIFIYR
jgi:hypothetical protein